jgi:hypothetical protein
MGPAPGSSADRHADLPQLPGKLPIYQTLTKGPEVTFGPPGAGEAALERADRQRGGKQWGKGNFPHLREWVKLPLPTLLGTSAMSESVSQR